MEFSYSQTEMEKLSSNTEYFKKPVEINMGNEIFEDYHNTSFSLNIKNHPNKGIYNFYCIKIKGVPVKAKLFIEATFFVINFTCLR